MKYLRNFLCLMGLHAPYKGIDYGELAFGQCRFCGANGPDVVVVRISPEALADILYLALSTEYDPEYHVGEPLVDGSPEDGERTLIDGDFDLVGVARRILHRVRAGS